MHASAELTAHPATPCPAVRRVSVRLDWLAGPARLLLTFLLEGEPGGLRIPPPAVPERRDGLWRRTCCELFLRAPGSAGYREFNFAPSGDWAAWRFAGRRAGREDLELAAAPTITCRELAGDWRLDVTMALAAEPVLAAGLAAVLEDRDGQLSYWALAHGAGAPDFHDPATQVLRLERGS